MMDASPYVELSRVWPLVLFFLVAVQLVLPRMILMTGVGQDPDSAWHFLRQTTRAGARRRTSFRCCRHHVHRVRSGLLPTAQPARARTAVPRRSPSPSFSER